MTLKESCRCCGGVVSVLAKVCPHCGHPNPGLDYADTIVPLLRQGKKIDAIKFVREQTGWGLAEAKEYVERFQ